MTGPPGFQRLLRERRYVLHLFVYQISFFSSRWTLAFEPLLVAIWRSRALAPFQFSQYTFDVEMGLVFPVLEFVMTVIASQFSMALDP